MDKPHAPTPRRLRRALREGDSPISIPLVRGGSLTVAILLLPAAAELLRARFGELLRTAVWRPETVAPLRVVEEVALIVGPMVAVAAFTALGLGLAQTGGVVTFRKVRPTFPRMTPSAFQGRSRTYDAMRGLTVTAVLLTIAMSALVTAGPDVARVVSGERGGLELAAGLVAHAVWLSTVALFVMAALDVAVRRAAWLRRWRMSPAEVAEEKRESEGDPGMRRARRRAHEELVRVPPREADGA